MTQYHNVDLTLLDSQFNKLKSAPKNATGITLRLSSNIFGTKKTYFSQKLSLTHRQGSSLPEGFASNSSANIKLSGTQPFEITESSELLGTPLGP